ncbi:cytochrome P450 [Glonium stellatum]|uniref:Cytochrome P450 n=1 Tax=Glonium stellatum TaxID=574774 RepID=A0A8E2EXE2_9PEZI|nr:cytochrome P450 [Glonium stellatum]
MTIVNSFLTLLAAAFAAVFFFFLATIIQTLLRDPLRNIPGPWYARFTNLRLKLAVVTGTRIYYVHSIHELYGQVVRISPNEVAVNDVHAFKQIHRVGSGFNKSPWYAEFNSGQAGVFAMSDPKQHAQRRRFFAKSFSKSFLRQHWEPLVLQKVQTAIRQIRAAGKNGTTVDVMKWWMFMATDVSTHLMFGESFQTLESGEKSSYTRMLETTLKGSGIAVELPMVAKILKRLPIDATKQMFNANLLLLEYGRTAVRNSRATGSKANIFASMIAEADNDESSQLTELDVSLEATNLIIAGADTTGITLTYLTWAVLERPELRRQLEHEVKDIGDAPSDEDLEKLPLLNAVVEETLRLYGAAPGGLPRVVPPGGAILAGFYIPGDTTVTTQAYSMHRDANNFTSPDSFNPSRWLSKETMEMSEAAKIAYYPFGAGARICLGIHLARMELRLAAALFFKEFTGANIAPSMSPSDMEMENYFLVAPKNHKCEILLHN